MFPVYVFVFVGGMLLGELAFRRYEKGSFKEAARSMKSGVWPIFLAVLVLIGGVVALAEIFERLR